MKLTILLASGDAVTLECDDPPEEFPLSAVRDLAYFLTWGVSPQMWSLMGMRVGPDENLSAPA